MADRIRAEVAVDGVVQGVGFRPFVYRRATEHDLGGSVRNTGDAGVSITVEGERGDVEQFLADLRERPPPLANVESVDVDRSTVSPSVAEDGAFRIEDSTRDNGGAGTIPPDTGICPSCLEDIRDPDSRFHRYWATSCVDCGPRYTVVRALPYDRPRTTMDEFPLCADCRGDYEDPADRRYHAQTIACPDCGPTLSLFETGETGPTKLATGLNAVRSVTARLARGEIAAIRGVGGTHLACDATDNGAVARLRERTGRPAKPFAVMAASVERVRSFAQVSDRERSALEDVRRPIVVLEKAANDGGGRDRCEGAVVQGVAPGLHTIGVMLPYAGLHHLLFDPFAAEDADGTPLQGPIVMTSANPPGEPMCLTVDSISDRLPGVVDAVLGHDREIVTRCDDSVVRFVDGSRRFLRRSRGWVPRPLPRRSKGPTILSFGAEFDATMAIARDDEVIPSQHLGDVDDPATEAFVRNTIDHLRELLGVNPSVVTCDAHPDYLTSRMAREYLDRLDAEHGSAARTGPITVQHHHAHAASLLAEHDRDRAVVITADGTGYGPDGTIWGGEVLDATSLNYERIGGLDEFRLPGGEAAVRRPARILASLLDDPDRVEELLTDRTDLDSSAVGLIGESLDAGINAPTTTSAGRFLDAISAMLDVGTRRRYEGEPAIRLEAAARRAEPVPLSIPRTTRDGRTVVDVRALAGHLDDLVETESTGTIAATAQTTLARGLADIAVEEAERRGVRAIGFTGGVATNEMIFRRIRETVTDAGIKFLDHERVPPGDAGLAYGQAIVASARLEAEPMPDRSPVS